MYDLVVVFGLSGAGKSFTARLILEELPGWHLFEVSSTFLRAYEENRGLQPGLLTQRPDLKELYRPEITRLARDLLGGNPGLGIEQVTELPRPLVVVGPRPLEFFARLHRLGALFVEVWDAREPASHSRSITDSFEQEMLQFTGSRISIGNNRDKASLQHLLRLGVIPHLVRPEL